ncbi:MAG TPA: hypothetical protein VJZ71_09885 [Phycisphaerae bacterium]|nr:hypothetical protein [Phycisphaerae bacterium]
MEQMEVGGLGLRHQALLAAVRLSGGELTKTFTAEDLLVEAWNHNKVAWGLRGFEEDYPDSEKINKELNRRGSIGLLGQGLIERVGPMMYRLSVAGLHEAAQLQPADTIAREKADRELEVSVKEILEHSVFRTWLADPSKPKYFREAGHFWGIAPGTPAKTVRVRISRVDRVLKAAKDILDEKGVDSITEQRGKLLFDREDVNRCEQFQQVLKTRFMRELQMLDPEFAH